MSEVGKRKAKGRTDRFGVLLVLCAGMFMAILDVNIVNIAVVSIQAEFQASLSAMTWAVDAYNLSLAGLMLSAGVLADRHGARRMWLLGLVLFTGASLGCAVSGSMTQLILSRLVQGAGAALFIPASFALMPVIWPDNAVRQRAVGLFGGIVAVAAAAGPVLGGVLISVFNWRSIFLINIPIGLGGLLAASRMLPAVPGRRRPGYDVMGQSFGILGLAGLSYVLIQLPGQGWRDTMIPLAALAALISAAGFFLAERRARAPMIPSALCRNGAFNLANTTGLLMNACYFGGIYALSLLLQQQMHYSPLQTGLALLPLAACLMGGNMLAGRLMVCLGVKKQMVIGLLLSACGYLGMLCLQQRFTPPVVIAMMALAGGTAFVVPPMTVTVLRSAPPSMTGTASAVHTTLRQIGSLIGVALAGLVFTLAQAPLAVLMPAAALIHLLLALAIGRFLAAAGPRE